MPQCLPEICPAQSCTEPVVSCTSGLVIVRIALAMIRLTVSPIPIGRTPGFLLRAIRRHASKGVVMDAGADLDLVKGGGGE